MGKKVTIRENKSMFNGGRYPDRVFTGGKIEGYIVPSKVHYLTLKVSMILKVFSEK